MDKYLILIVEDDRDLNRGLCAALRAPDRTIVCCGDLRTAREQLLVSQPSLMLLDISLPDGSGLDLLRELREQASDLPVVLLTANDTDMDIVEGFEYGADDYITKPFSLAVLRARIQAQLRRHGAGDVYIQGPYRFDFTHMQFFVEGRAIELSRTEQKLLRTLTRSANRTCTREVLAACLWGDGADYIDENALSVTVKRLRDKLSTDHGRCTCIRTVYGLGYQWVVSG